MAKFINPYNFIPLGSGSENKAENEDRNLTGVIEYSLVTKTPLFIPNTSNAHAIKPEIYAELRHKSFEFFAYEDLTEMTAPKTAEDLRAPVIPGSEMRGMLRSNFEILTDSCLSAIDDDIILSRRSPSAFTSALIRKNEDGTYDLIEAEDCLLRTLEANSLEVDLDWENDNNHNGRKCYVQRELSEGQKVYVVLQRRDRGKPIVKKIFLERSDADSIANKGNVRGSIREGYVLKGEDGPAMENRGTIQKNQKHCCHILVLPDNMKKKVIQKELDVSVLDTTLKIYKDEGAHTYTEYSKCWETFKKGICNTLFPVYYSRIDNSVYIMLSPAALTRDVFEKRLSDLLPHHKPCKDPRKLCPACRLFGTIQKGRNGKNFSVSSRVRITDLTVAESGVASELYEVPIMLKELSSPKLGNVEFYLTRPKNAYFWNYDYYVDENGKVRAYKAQLNGRKFFWHDLNMKLDQARASEETERNITVRPVRRNVHFKGKLYFDGISKNELNYLIYLINAGEDAETLEEKRHGYKLGGAKPLGFGSVAMSVEAVKLRKIEIDTQTETVRMNPEANAPEYQDPNVPEQIAAHYKKMTDFHTIDELTQDGYKLSYPISEKTGDESKVYEWFVDNHKGYDHKNHKDIPMLRDRSQMVLREYMTAMQPELSSIGLLYSASQAASQHHNRQSNQSANGKKSFRQRSALQSHSFIIGKQYEGVVDGHNRSGQFAYVRLSQGGRASFRDGGKCSDGTKVKLIYRGNDDQGFPKWDRV